MKTMNTTEKNNLIAEFMGVDQVDIDTYLEHNSILKYHFSWDWLMPVVDKIEGEKAVVKMHRHWGALPDDPIEDLYFCTIQIDNGEVIDVAYVDTKIEAVYNAVIEFIKRTQQ